MSWAHLKGRRSKYRVRTDAAGIAARTVDGRVFHSLKEARRYRTLKALEAAGELPNLECQVPYALVVNAVKIAVYRADFRYRRRSGELVTEDCKGMLTDVYKIKAKLVKALHGVEIVEV